MHQVKKLALKITLATVSAILIAVILLAWYGYTAAAQSKLLIAMSKVLPAAFVNGNLVSLFDQRNYLEIAGNLNPDEPAGTAQASFIKFEQEKVLLSSLHHGLTADELTQENAFLTSGKDTEMTNLINNYYLGNQLYFTNYLVQPELALSELEIYYNSQTNLNQTAYAQAQTTLKSIQGGEKFDDMAAQLSADKQSGQLGGDLGFVDAHALIPELQAAVVSAPIGQVDPDIVVSRDGYHILEVVETADQNGLMTWHVKHILIPTTGFDSWLNSQLQKVSTWQIVRPK